MDWYYARNNDQEKIKMLIDDVESRQFSFFRFNINELIVL